MRYQIVKLHLLASLTENELHMTKLSLDSTAMDLNISNNGREYTVEWTIPAASSASEKQQSVEFEVRGETYIMDFLYLNDGKQLTLKLCSKKPLVEEAKVMRSRPRITASKDSTNCYPMAETSKGQWGPVLWTCFPFAGITDQLIKVVMDFGPQLKTGESNVLDYLGRLLREGTDSDVEFIIKGEKINGHKLILRGGSPVLAAIFQHDKTSHQPFEIKDVEPKVFRQLLHYLYTGDAPDAAEEDVTEPLFVAADRYKVDSLKDWCSCILSQRLKEDCAIHSLVLAHLHCDDRLKEDCIKFIVKNKTAFWELDEFKKLGESYFSLFYEATKRMNSSSGKNTDDMKKSPSLGQPPIPPIEMPILQSSFKFGNAGGAGQPTTVLPSSSFSFLTPAKPN